jgi:hypothetical protein
LNENGGQSAAVLFWRSGSEGIYDNLDDFFPSFRFFFFCRRDKSSPVNFTDGLARCCWTG